MYFNVSCICVQMCVLILIETCSFPEDNWSWYLWRTKNIFPILSRYWSSDEEQPGPSHDVTLSCGDVMKCKQALEGKSMKPSQVRQPGLCSNTAPRQQAPAIYLVQQPWAQLQPGNPAGGDSNLESGPGELASEHTHKHTHRANRANLLCQSIRDFSFH